MRRRRKKKRANNTAGVFGQRVASQKNVCYHPIVYYHQLLPSCHSHRNTLSHGLTYYKHNVRESKYVIFHFVMYCVIV